MRHVFIQSFIVLSFLAITSSIFAMEESSGTTITLENTAHFLAADGSDVFIQPGTYLVEAAEEWLRLVPGERRNALLIEAMQSQHHENLKDAKAFVRSGEADEHRIVLLLPGGTGLEAIGSVSRVRSPTHERILSLRTRNRHQQNSRIPIQPTKRPVVTKSKPQPRSPGKQKNHLAKRVETLELQVHSLQTLVQTLQDQLTMMASAIQVDNAGQITIGQAGPVTIKGSTIDLNSASLTAQAGMSKFNGVVQTDTVIANSIVSASYTPGAGNIW